MFFSQARRSVTAMLFLLLVQNMALLHAQENQSSAPQVIDAVDFVD